LTSGRSTVQNSILSAAVEMACHHWSNVVARRKYNAASSKLFLSSRSLWIILYPIVGIYLSGISLPKNLFIIEVAQERAELNNQGRGKEVVPPLQKYLEAINLLSDRLEKEKFTGLSKMIQSFRLEYYQLTKHILEKKRQIIPCYAGFASAQIAPNGEVWFCPTKAKPVGNLRKSNYKFEKIWFSEKADELRRENNKGNCYCCLASIAYINMLYHFNSLLKVFIRFIKYNFKS